MTVATPAIEPAVAASRPDSPYVGLVPYDEDDAPFFFGRSTEAAIVAANLRSAPLTILYGPSGVGKSSLLMAGAVHQLRNDARTADDDARFAVCVYRSWHDEPMPGLQEDVRVVLQELAGDEPLPPPATTLAETLRAWTAQTGSLLLVFDQFEEYFQYHSDESDERLTGFAAELTRIVNDPTLEVHVLLSIREDAWAKLDRFKGRIPSLFSNYLRVDHLDVKDARKAIEEPIAAWNGSLPDKSEPYAIESALTDAVLQAAAGGGLTLTAGSESVAGHEASGDRVEAPFLQLVLERLWRETVAAGEHTLTLARLETLGGARRIVENHLLDALAMLSQPEQDIASDCFRFLVSRSKTKIAHPAADLAEWTKRPEPQVTAVLDKLGSGESGRILRAVAPAQNGGSTSYELFHDVLAEPILAWHRNHEAERSRRVARRRVIRVGSILVLLLAVFGAVCVWALVQRSDAKNATTSATSLALASAANDQLGTRVDESLLLSLEALKSRPTVQARSSMISALETARLLAGNASLTGNSDAVRSVAFSPDGTTLISGSDDWTVRLWDVHTHKQIGEPLRGNAAAVSSVAFSPDGKTLASAGFDKTVRLWNVGTHKQIGDPLRAHAGIAWGVAFSPDGNVLASAHDDGTVRLWDIRTHNEIGRLRGHSAAGVSGVAFSPDGKTLASAGYDDTVRLWSVRKHKQLGRPFLGNTSSVWGVAFSPDGKTLASAGYDKTVRLWSVRKHKQLGRPLLGHTGPVNRVAFSPDGTTLASASNDKTVRLWDVRTHKRVGEPRRGHTGIAFSVAFSPDGTTLASSSDDDTVRLWDLRPHPPLGFPLLGHTKDVPAVAFSPDGSTLASVSIDKAVRLWDVHTLKPIGKTLLGHTGKVYGVDFSPDGTTLASGSWDETVRLWNVRTHRQIGRPLVDRSGAVSGVAFSPDGATLASTGGDTVRLWNVQTHEEIGQPFRGHTDSVSDVDFSPDGSMLASASWDGTVRLWDVSTHKQLDEPLDERGAHVYSVVFSPDGTKLATASADTTLRLWDVRTHKQIGRPFRGHTDEVGAVAFSPDGAMLVSGGTDGAVRLWDVATHKQLGPPLLGHTTSVYAVAFSPSGTMLASGGQDSTVRLWNGMLWRNFAGLKAKVCQLAGGNLTRAEWDDLAPGISYRRSCPS